MYKENGQKETDKLKVELINLGTVNKNCVKLSKGIHEINLYFSYKTLIAVNQYVSTNEFSQTTGKLLNELEPDKTKRISHTEILKKADELIKVVVE